MESAYVHVDSLVDNYLLFVLVSVSFSEDIGLNNSKIVKISTYKVIVKIHIFDILEAIVFPTSSTSNICYSILASLHSGVSCARDI